MSYTIRGQNDEFWGTSTCAPIFPASLASCMSASSAFLQTNLLESSKNTHGLRLEFLYFLFDFGAESFSIGGKRHSFGMLLLFGHIWPLAMCPYKGNLVLVFAVLWSDGGRLSSCCFDSWWYMQKSRLHFCNISQVGNYNELYLESLQCRFLLPPKIVWDHEPIGRRIAEGASSVPLAVSLAAVLCRKGKTNRSKVQRGQRDHNSCAYLNLYWKISKYSLDFRENAATLHFWFNCR